MAAYVDHLRITKTLLDQQAQISNLTAERDGAYRERAHLVAWLAALHPAVIASARDIAEPGWQIVYLTTDDRQMSWHIHPQDAALFEGVEHVPADHPRAQWDGHTTDQKYERMRNHTRVIHAVQNLAAPQEPTTVATCTCTHDTCPPNCPCHTKEG